MSNKFNVGDRVRAIGDVSGLDLSGKVGTVIATDHDMHNDINVKFDERFTEGHDCDGECEHGYGRHCESGEFELVKSLGHIFKSGVKIKLKCYSEHCDHKEHDGQLATVIEVKETVLEIMWQDESRSLVYFDEKSNPYIVNDELKNNKMEIEDVKNFDKAVLKEAKKNVLKARKEVQTAQAERLLASMLDFKDEIEDKIGTDQAALNQVSEDLKVFDAK